MQPGNKTNVCTIKRINADIFTSSLYESANCDFQFFDTPCSSVIIMGDMYPVDAIVVPPLAQN